MRNFLYGFILAAFILSHVKFSYTKEINLTSKDFQKEFLQKIGDVMKSSASKYLNNFLEDIKKSTSKEEIFNHELNMALESTRLEPKIVFVKQYLDMEEHRDPSRENIYGLRNVIFLKKLKDTFYELEEQSFEEIHQLRYSYLCKKFKIRKMHPTPAYHNYYSPNSFLAPINMPNISSQENNHTISLNVTEFGQELYKRINTAGAEIINDYLIILRKLLQEVLEPMLEEEATSHSDALIKIITEIDALLKTTDLYSKRQRLYNYLENHLALDYELLQSSESSQHNLMEIFEKLKQKGLNLVVAYLFSNFEFIDQLHIEWQQQLPPAPLSLYDAHSQPLKFIQHLYDEFKQDFENSSKYDSYLEAAKKLHEQTQQENTDTTHIYEMLYSAAQNVGSSRATLMNSKCNEI